MTKVTEFDCIKFQSLQGWRYGSYCGTVTLTSVSDPTSITTWHTCLPRYYKDPRPDPNCETELTKDGLRERKTCICSDPLCNPFPPPKEKLCHVCNSKDQADSDDFEHPEYLRLANEACEDTPDATQQTFDCSKLTKFPATVKITYVCYQKYRLNNLERGCSKALIDSKLNDAKTAIIQTPVVYAEECGDPNDCECKGSLCNNKAPDRTKVIGPDPDPDKGVTCQICEDPGVEAFVKEDPRAENIWKFVDVYQEMLNGIQNCKSSKSFDCRNLHKLDGWRFGSACQHATVTFKDTTRTDLHQKLCVPRDRMHKNGCKNLGMKAAEVESIEVCSCAEDNCDLHVDKGKGSKGGIDLSALMKTMNASVKRRTHRNAASAKFLAVSNFAVIIIQLVAGVRNLLL